jgi:DNA-binding phage protein
MPLSRDFKELVVSRAEKDPIFRRALITEALNMILRGELMAGRLMIRDYINATGAMNEIAIKLRKQKPAIVRMLGPNGNPTLESFIPVVQACAERENIELNVCEGNCSARH